MAQSALKVKKSASNAGKKKPSKVGLNKRKKGGNSAINIARTKIEKKLESSITSKIESEMTQRLKKNNGKLSVLKAEVVEEKKKKK
ncbi:hypothetical protein CYY_003338 [Polysphondylium violaceum]|uniref:Uncharacterized protein n=1 Tax=Polysphondylium violaceum TaxID=133409 RepID=A0A8J4V609_9MYCE|nr:hypothetical protein CYY_003338 [Polysphondylium violaceum]